MAREVRLDPHWENMAAWQANALATHSFEVGAREPVVSFIEQIRYLAQLDERDGLTGHRFSRLERLMGRISNGRS